MINYITKLYVLNLPHRIDRLNFQLNQFTKYNIDNYEIINPVVVDNANNFLNKAIYSCYLSHLRILEQIKLNQQLCLILEDDANIVDINKINSCLDDFFNSNLDWDMFYFYYYKPINITNNEQYIKIDKVLNTHAYMVNPQAVSDILDILYRYKDKIETKQIEDIKNCHIDRAYALEVHKIKNIFASTTRLITQNKQFCSDIPWFRPDSN